MRRIEESVEINCPIEKVFAYVADARSWPKWHFSMLEADQTSPGAIGVGTTFRGVNKVMGRRRAWTSKVTEYEINTRWQQSITSGGTLIDEHLAFKSVEQGTRFTQVYNMKVGGFLRLFAPIVISTMRKELKTDLSSLKAIVEAQS